MNTNAKIILASSIALALSSVSVSVAFAADNTQAQIDQLKADIHTVHINTLSKYSESWGLEDRANIAALQNSKVDKSVFAADQARQDAALNNAISSQSKRDAGQDEHIGAVQSAAQTANDRASNLESRADVIETQAANLDNRVGKTETRLDVSEQAIRDVNAQADSDRQQQIDGDAVLQNQAVNEQNARINGDTANAAAITEESRTRASENVRLASGVTRAQETGDYALGRADQAFSNAEANARSIRNTNAVVAEHNAQLSNHETRITGLEQQVNNNWKSLNGKIERVQRRANAGISGALSAANIPQVTEYQRFSVGAGVGGYEGESALAVGFSSRLSTSIVLKASVTTDSQHGTGYGAGLSFGW